MLFIFKWRKALVLTLVVMAAAGWAAYHSEWFQRQYIYPFPKKQAVFYYAEHNDLDPYLVAAVIRTESKFFSEARSVKGAIGLMQIMPETGRWVAGEINYPDFSTEDLYDPDINIRFGTWYLASLKGEFQANENLMLAAYNGGRGNVKQWMRQFSWSENFREVDQIPFRETREYVKKVLDAREKYRKLYPQ
jgi:soluble lytic murein transglycosylase